MRPLPLTDPDAAGDGRSALRVSEVARRLGVNEETVRRALVRGELPGRKLGSTWLVSVKAPDGWLSSTNEVRPWTRVQSVLDICRASLLPAARAQTFRDAIAKRADLHLVWGVSEATQIAPWRSR